MSSSDVSINAADAQGCGHTVKKLGRALAAVSRKEWIKEWCQNNPDKPTPCSAKAVYRLADRMCFDMSKIMYNRRSSGLGLLDLKDRAAQVCPSNYEDGRAQLAAN